MSEAFTIEILRTTGKRGRFYISDDIRIFKTARHCKKLSFEQAQLALVSLLTAFAILGTEPIDVHVVELA